MKAKLLVRQHDKHGAGYYKAPRGSRLHNGIDYAAPVGYDFRYFYLSPLVKVNEYVYTETPIGTVQDLEPRYNGITPHCHLEVKKYGQFINPEEIE